jgi:Transposase DNA-binding
MKLRSLLPSRRTSNHSASEHETWVDREVAGCEFQDVRLGERFRKLLKQIGSAIGQAIPFACQDWANTKAAYRFFSNDRVDEEAILSGHFEATRDRFAATDGYVLVLHDTTEFTFKREKPELIGSTCIVNGKGKKGRITFLTVCGILMHSSLVVTTEGLPLDLAAIKFWTRKKFKGSRSGSIRREFPSKRKKVYDG